MQQEWWDLQCSDTVRLVTWRASGL